MIVSYLQGYSKLFPLWRARAPNFSSREVNVNNETVANTTVTTKSSKEEIIAAIQACAARLGHVPSQAELKQEIGLHEKVFMRRFGNYTKTLLRRPADWKAEGSGFMLSLNELFHEWARIVRLLGRDTQPFQNTWCIPGNAA